MPVHDWTRADGGLFHDFHQSWTTRLRNALNSGILPPNYFALVEQNVRGPIPDVLTLKGFSTDVSNGVGNNGLAVASAPPKTHLVQKNVDTMYARKANRIAIRHKHGDVVAVIEIVSPGNKASRAELRAFVEKAADLLRQGVHLLVVDLFPPSKRDPAGVHKAIWDELQECEFEMPSGKSLTLASYDAGPPQVAYVEPLAFGAVLLDMPLFLRPETYVLAPLEATYLEAWNDFPAVLRSILE